MQATCTEIGFNMVEITHSRGIAHLNSGAERVVVRNYVLHIPEGRTCVILDDVRTTGRSCADLAAAKRLPCYRSCSDGAGAKE